MKEWDIDSVGGKDIGRITQIIYSPDFMNSNNLYFWRDARYKT